MKGVRKILSTIMIFVLCACANNTPPPSTNQFEKTNHKAENKPEIFTDINAYIYAVRARIHGNEWTRFHMFTAPLGTFAVVEILIDRDGKLVETKIVESSGNEIYNRAVKKAVSLAHPFPVFQDKKGFREKIRLRFLKD